MVENVFNLIVYILNTIIWLFGKTLSFVFSVLPDSPFLNIFPSVSRSNDDYLNYLAWLLPIKQLVQITALWLSAMLLYYIYSAVMRWIKLID